MLPVPAAKNQITHRHRAFISNPRLFRSFLSQAVRSLDASLSVISLRAHSLTLDTFSSSLESPPLPAHSRWAVTRKKGAAKARTRIHPLLVTCIPRRFLSTPPQNLPIDSRANGRQRSGHTSVPNAPPLPPHVCTRLSHTGNGSGDMPTADH